MKQICVLASLALAVCALPASLVSVEGAVQKPGKILIADNARLKDAIKLAGGLASDADAKQVLVISLDGQESVVDTTKLGPSPVLKAGARIVVQKFDASHYVIVNGAVQSPGLLEYKEGMSASEALSKAKMFTDVQNESIKVTRTSNGKQKVSEIKLKDLHAFALQPGDKVEVAYGNQSFSDREILTILLIVVLVILIVR